MWDLFGLKSWVLLVLWGVDLFLIGDVANPGPGVRARGFLCWQFHVLGRVTELNVNLFFRVLLTRGVNVY